MNVQGLILKLLPLNRDMEVVIEDGEWEYRSIDDVWEEDKMIWLGGNATQDQIIKRNYPMNPKNDITNPEDPYP